MNTHLVKSQFYIVLAVTVAILLGGCVQTELSASAVGVDVTSTEMREVPNPLEGETTNAQSEIASSMELKPGTLPYLYVQRYSRGWLENGEGQAVAGSMELKPGTLPYLYVNLYGRDWLENGEGQPQIANSMELKPGTLPYLYVQRYSRGWLENGEAQPLVVQK